MRQAGPGSAKARTLLCTPRSGRHPTAAYTELAFERIHLRRHASQRPRQSRFHPRNESHGTSLCGRRPLAYTAGRVRYRAVFRPVRRRRRGDSQQLSARSLGARGVAVAVPACRGAVAGSAHGRPQVPPRRHRTAPRSPRADHRLTEVALRKPHHACCAPEVGQAALGPEGLRPADRRRATQTASPGLPAGDIGRRAAAQGRTVVVREVRLYPGRPLPAGLGAYGLRPVRARGAVVCGEMFAPSAMGCSAQDPPK
jgi:hypothetical protein